MFGYNKSVEKGITLKRSEELSVQIFPPTKNAKIAVQNLRVPQAEKK